jgi:hypothetical protein
MLGFQSGAPIRWWRLRRQPRPIPAREAHLQSVVLMRVRGAGSRGEGAIGHVNSFDKPQDGDGSRLTEKSKLGLDPNATQIT